MTTTTPAKGACDAFSIEEASPHAPSVLLVDDQPARLLSYEAALAGIGVNCVRALSGEEALRQLLEREFAVIVLDVNMPGMDGYETARTIRANPKLQRTPIIFVTAVYDSLMEQLKGYEAGAIDYISIPVAPEILLSKVSLLVELYNRRTELEKINIALEGARAKLESEHSESLAVRAELLRERTELYHAVFERPAEFAVIFDAVRNDRGEIFDWRYRDANANALTQLKRSREKLIGRCLSEVLPEHAPSKIPELRQVLESRAPRRYEANIDGSDFLISLFPVGNETVVSSAIDITARTQVTRQLQQQSDADRAEKEWLAAVLDSMTEEVYFTDDQGRHMYANPAAMRVFDHTTTEGILVEEIIGKLAIFRPDGSPRPLAEAPPLRALRGEVVKDQEEIMRVPVGDELRHNQVSSAPVRNADGRIIGSVSVVRDVTEQKRAEAALHEAAKRKDEFIAVLAHELRNPLAALAAAAQLLSKPEQNPAVMSTAREAMQRQVYHMARLLDDLLDVARITHGRIQLKSTPLDLPQILRTAVETVRPQSEAKQQHLESDLGDIPIHVQGDAVRVAQIASNLLTNAIKYTAAHGHIQLCLRVEQSSAVIAVSDDGFGIAPDALPKIFEMFSQAAQSRGINAGLGIGLALVKGLVELHGGTIEAYSEGEGKGSEFRVYLPLAESAPVEQQPLPAAKETSHPLRVLVADDNVDAANSWSILLSQQGHMVHTAFDGRAALREAEEFRPEIALLDLGMPYLTGYEVATRIRAANWGKLTVLVAVTGWGQARDRQKARAAGFDYHLTKPIKPGDIENILDLLPRAS